MESVHLSSIPQEVLELILESEVLSLYDVCTFGSTCTDFWQLTRRSNKIWKAKFKQRWPQLMQYVMLQNLPIKGWRDACKQRCLIGQETMALVSQMAAQHIRQQLLSDCDFQPFMELNGRYGHKMALLSMIDELMLCAHGENRNTKLTDKYYSEKVLRHLRQVYLTEKWIIFKTLSPEEQILERGAVIVAQWCQPLEEVTDTAIARQLDSIADEVRSRLLQEYGETHPAVTVSADLRARWHTHNLTDNHYSPYVSRQVLQMVSTVLFQELGFFGNYEMYYSFENSFINKVLELRRGIPITLAIVFESITRRLGIKCEPVSFPGHFLLRWRDTYRQDIPCQYFYIDVFNGGTFLGKDSCPQFANSRGGCPMSKLFQFSPSSAIQVVERMANNLTVAGRQRDVINGRTARIRSALELRYLVNPTCLEGLMQIVRLYMEHSLDLRPLHKALEADVELQKFDARDMGQVQQLMCSLDVYCVIPVTRSVQDHVGKVKPRPKDCEVRYAVGMVMRHRQYDYMCVVISWDPRCLANEEWRAQMNINRLSRKEAQPFYHVLVCDGTNRYAAEENLELPNDDRDRWIMHCEVGRYFDTFCGTHYQPNHELQRLYPDDNAVLQKCFGLP